MTTLGVDAILATFGRSSTPGIAADYAILSVEGPPPRHAHFARSRLGAPALLIPLSRAAPETSRVTHGLTLKAVNQLELARGDLRWTEPTAVLECRDPELLNAFAPLAAAILARLDSDDKPAWERVVALFVEWERLLGRRTVLTGESELGLWGELWLLGRTSNPDDLLAAWRGPEAEHVDFFIGGRGFEVKTSRRPGVHMLSQAQVEQPLGDAAVVLVSLCVVPDPLRGRSLAELVVKAAARIIDMATFEEKLASVGYSRVDEDAYRRRFALVEAPAFYPRERLPRIRSADPGVSLIRYQAELARETALSGSVLDTLLADLALNCTAWSYPCA